MITYRIVDIGILTKMFKERRNYLSSPKNWSDKWEKLNIELAGESKTGQFERTTAKIFSQCWSTESYSWALWKMNSPYGYGVRIKSKTEKIYASLPLEVRRKYRENQIIKRVEYLKEEEIQERIRRTIKSDGVNISSVMTMFFLKRRAFAFENEVRLILPRLARFSKFKAEMLGERSYLTYSCNPCKFLESINFDSNIDPYVYNVFKSIFRDFGFRGPIYRSGIDKNPKKIRINA